MKSLVTELAAGVKIHSLVGENTSHVVERNGRSVLIDCHSSHIARWLDRRGLPHPEWILHTQVQPEHCREAGQFPAARILVHAALAELAGNRAAYERAAHTVWDKPAEWSETLGREPYGVAGSITVFPPAEPLKVAGTFREGERLNWQDLVFEAIPLPVAVGETSGMRARLAMAPAAIVSSEKSGPRIATTVESVRHSLMIRSICSGLL